MANFGLEFTYVDTTDPRNVERAIRKNTRYVYIETPTNPLMGLTDIAAVSAIAHKRGCEVVVDNTFMSPYFQQPIKFGADMVMHSTTKFLNGHSDGLGRRARLHDERTGRETGIHSKSRGRNPVALRVLAGVARHQDAGCAHETARRQRTRHGRLSQPASQGEASVLSGTEEPSAIRAGVHARCRALAR